MNILKKKINQEYIDFTKNYIELLANDKFWEFPINSIFQRINKNSTLSDIDESNIPDKIKNIEYVEVQLKSSERRICPPGVIWVSKSGRFSCQSLDVFISYQTYILWDLKRKTFLPIPLHDLEGIDEEREIVYCRPLVSELAHNFDSPHQFNLNKIEESSLKFRSDLETENNIIDEGLTFINNWENISEFLKHFNIKLSNFYDSIMIFIRSQMATFNTTEEKVTELKRMLNTTNYQQGDEEGLIDWLIDEFNTNEILEITSLMFLVNNDTLNLIHSARSKVDKQIREIPEDGDLPF